jgi:hypothetical protein
MVLSIAHYNAVDSTIVKPTLASSTLRSKHSNLIDKQ